MAQVFPTLQQIRQLKVQPEIGEWALLSFLTKNLDDSYEIYFQPFLDGDMPDIVIMREGGGVLIVEVKDWNLNSYFVDQEGNWSLQSAPTVTIRSPLAQVQQYRDHLYELHIDRLLEKSIINSRHWAIVKCAVYFHNANQEHAEYHCETDKDYEHIEIIGSNSLIPHFWKQLLHKTWLSRQSKYFDTELLKSFHRFFQPTYHHESDGKHIQYSPKQNWLIISKPGHQKISGVVGAGKTRVLAARAVNAYKRTGERIMILTFNITLRNYIHDRISDVRENFSWDNFYITHYHQLISKTVNNMGLSINKNTDFLTLASDLSLFESIADKIPKYQAILIDEIQDYQEAWIRILKMYFLADNGEFVVFGDAKQNVYQNEMNIDKMPNTTIPGRWNELKETYRLPEHLMRVAHRFQQQFLAKRYQLDELKAKQFGLPLSHQMIQYHYLGSNVTYQQIVELILTIIYDLGIHSNDVAIIGSLIDPLRQIDKVIRDISHEKTTTTFETQEIWNHLKQLSQRFKWDLETIRHYKKYKFQMNPGTMKIVTMHSFKGWEIDTIFVVLNSEQKLEEQGEWLTEELVYTALTRCRQNLIIINLGNDKYHPFFSEVVG